MENSLLNHPLALFPHLEESVPPEVRHLYLLEINLLIMLDTLMLLIIT